MFDSYHGVVGFDIFPFAITTRVAGSDTIYLKVYEEYDTDTAGDEPGIR